MSEILKTRGHIGEILKILKVLHNPEYFSLFCFQPVPINKLLKR